MEEMKEGKTPKELIDLVERALRLGASNAVVICSTDISVEDGLASLCQEPPCENYGRSAGCPPHVSGPDGFRKLIRELKQAVVFKIDVPTEVLFSSERRDLFRLLHEIGAGIERLAVQRGYLHSKAYVGGSCKQIFCQEHPECRILGEGGKCRNPDLARPSMSGFGINVTKLMQTAGWTMHRATRETGKAESSMGTLCGLVLVG